MRKTLNINLGGMAFIIDENAFELLHTYLEALKQKFNNEAERNEIMNDIEARIAEMLNQKLAGKKEVISIEDVQPVIDAMGKPEDIAGEESADNNQQAKTSANTTSTAAGVEANTQKRLFRDPDDTKVGGVISGLCHYFGINDPVWVRIAAVCLIPLTSGSIILLYFLLMIVIPKANTAAEKLQMKGEPININTIEKEIKEAASKTSESVQHFVKSNNVFEKIWHIIVSIASVVLKLVAGFVIFIGLIVLIALLASVLGISMAGNALVTQAPLLLVDSHSTITLFNIGLLLFIGTPVVALLYAALRLILGGKGNANWLKWTLLCTWIAGLILLGVSAYKTGIDFQNSGTKKDTYALMQPANGSLFVQLVDSAGNKISADDDDDNLDFHVGYNGVFINGEELKDIQTLNIGEPDLQLTASNNDSFYIEQTVTSRGRTKSDAIKNGEHIIYSFGQRDTVLNLPAYIMLNKTNKWRGQNMKITLAIPEGKTIRFANNIDRWHAIVKGDRSYDDTYFANTSWIVEKGKVKCTTGENHFNAQKENDEEKDKDDNSDSDKSDKKGKDSNKDF